MSDLLEVCEVRVEESVTQTAKVRVLRVVDLDDAPRVATTANELAVDLDLFL